MSYLGVFESLRELFPQVDARILKAASIEHANNVDAAIDFILQEVIPSIPEPSYSLENSENKSSLYQASPEGLNKKTEEASTSSISSTPSPVRKFTSDEKGKAVLHSNESELDEGSELYNSIVSTIPPKRNGSHHQVLNNEGMSRSSSESRNWDLSVLIANNRASSQDGQVGNYPDQSRENGGHKVGLKENETDGSNGLNDHHAFESEVNAWSSHSVNAESLEDIVSDAKSSKVNLVFAIEMLTTMLNNVVQLEEKAKSAKEEASTAGQNTLSKVEDLKQMLLRAKEANDMHAGEVFGERSILSTEARELQSRLRSLSDEKNNSLEIIEEINRTLEARLAAAQEEILKAENLRLEREESAQRILKEQEEMMNAIVEESKKLQKEAEENTKLREFLVERGRVVDSLQGEIAVICEDITRLKEIVEGHLPMTKSMLSTISSLSSSYSSSSGSLNKSTSSHKDATNINSNEKTMATQSETSDGDGSNLINKNDGWELFEESWISPEQ
ncbi:ELKS/Rab6-interacting/CAST family protein [Rhynchospora pubera]|uniref:ELKS/Rab6-interacting/CAST family protein n=1 Tax=Rhynchospora pubera TaxID=906938 RepID=A0AAV8GZA2_9POAL|nr:ELKS/Rab6-interacting/CAST family protein [Rhynchospora pubera]